ncbi:hypothetical protein DAY19_11695 [Halobacteriovorax vibrionivorans]|uniref:RHS repeat-associated core domain-containing protein n=1 Tax=Halobacteriovorax vibrionivorans TaxID=2152716 RepID=A0ABY0IEW0_9BACT|nr:hypothetical protein DAY19_11695 [Halobacteriovorax vibrionivorans]TGD48972.1 hypothetical protein EP118_02035 [Halobacteriovorax sp. Y22]
MYSNRYYNSSVGQFISEDPIGFSGGDANMYRYVKNNPLVYFDPFGLDKAIYKKGVHKVIRIFKEGEYDFYIDFYPEDNPSELDILTILSGKAVVNITDEFDLSGYELVDYKKTDVDEDIETLSEAYDLRERAEDGELKYSIFGGGPAGDYAQCRGVSNELFK